MSAQLVKLCAGIAKVMGSNPAQACMLFFKSYFHYCSSSVHHCEVRFHSRSTRDGEISHVGTVQTIPRISSCCKPHLGSRSISRVGCQTCGKTKRNTHKKEIKRNVFKFGVCESTYEFCEASRSEKKKKKKKNQGKPLRDFEF